MIADKLRSLNNAIGLSYQSATAILEDSREFKCLINENKITLEEDNKILSIPFQGACLNKDNTIESTDVHCGSVIHWKETNSYWIVYSQFLSELAYFRGAMRRCEDDTIDVNGRAYRYYLKGPSEQGIDWQKSKRFIFNELNYTVEIYISNNSETK